MDQQPPEITPAAPEWSIETCVPQLAQKVQQTLAVIPEEMRPLGKKAIEVTFHPTEKDTFQFLDTESMREQVAALKAQHQEAGYDFDELFSHGIAIYIDGKHMRVASDKAGSSVGDAYNLGNSESVLQAAEAMGCDALITNYSGDENLAFFIPKSKTQYTDPETWNPSLVKQTINEKNHAYFYDKASPTGRFFEEKLLTPLRKNANPGVSQLEGDMGCSIETAFISAMSADIPDTGQTQRERTVMSILLDKIKESGKEEPQHDGLFGELLLHAISQKTMLDEQDRNWSDPTQRDHLIKSLPPSIRQQYIDLVKEHHDPTDRTAQFERQGLAYALQASYERLFREGLVYKDEYREEVCQEYLTNHPDMVLILERGAASMLKADNRKSHYTGDQAMIYTAEVTHAVKTRIAEQCKNTGEETPPVFLFKDRGSLTGGTPIPKSLVEGRAIGNDGIIRLTGEEAYTFLEENHVSQTEENIYYQTIRENTQLRRLRANLARNLGAHRTITMTPYDLFRGMEQELQAVAKNVGYRGEVKAEPTIAILTAAASGKAIDGILNTVLRPQQYAVEILGLSKRRSDVLLNPEDEHEQVTRRRTEIWQAQRPEVNEEIVKKLEEIRKVT